jgi:hypothetical protein
MTRLLIQLVSFSNPLKNITASHSHSKISAAKAALTWFECPQAISQIFHHLRGFGL